jgi:hypothetical protein
VKSDPICEAYIRVLILSIGNKAKSIEVPAIPPANVAITNVLKVKKATTT